MSPEQNVGQLLLKKHKTLSVAESCSGGLLGHTLTCVPGCSAYFTGGVIVYSDMAKNLLLGVSPRLIKTRGAVSGPVARAMAVSVRRLFRTDYGIAITGIAGPSGGSQKKPVGLTYIAASGPHKTVCRVYRFTGTRSSVKAAAVKNALTLLIKII